MQIYEMGISICEISLRVEELSLFSSGSVGKSEGFSMPHQELTQFLSNHR